MKTGRKRRNKINLNKFIWVIGKKNEVKKVVYYGFIGCKTEEN